MSKFVLSKQALDDLCEIWDYIAEQSIEQADHVERKLQEEFHKLAKTPGLGHLREDITEKGLKFWRVFDFLVVYVPDTNPLQIVTIIHGRRELKAFFAKFV